MAACRLHSNFFFPNLHLKLERINFQMVRVIIGKAITKSRVVDRSKSDFQWVTFSGL